MYKNSLWKSVKPTLCHEVTAFLVDHSKDLFPPETGLPEAVWPVE